MTNLVAVVAFDFSLALSLRASFGDVALLFAVVAFNSLLCISQVIPFLQFLARCPYFWQL